MAEGRSIYDVLSDFPVCRDVGTGGLGLLGTLW